MPEVSENSKLIRLVERRNILLSEVRGTSFDERFLDASMQINLQDFCAEVALRTCPLEARGLRCWNCRPLLISVRSKVATHYATFQANPKVVQ